MRISEIFIAGGLPTVTYNPRLNLNLEARLLDYIETGYKLISITGPTKSGKTVLCTKLLPEDSSIFISGGSVKEEKELWDSILNELEVDIRTTTTKTKTDIEEKSGDFNGSIGLGIFKVGAKQGDKESNANAEATVSNKVSNNKLIAIQNLIENNITLIIDDFHYINKDIQQSIIRSLKQPIFKGLRVIILAVPHRAYDALRVESEMTGRVVQLPIQLWELEELKQIAILGFKALNLECPEEIIDRLAVESFGSPHLMQEFCFRLCKFNDIISKVEGTPQVLSPPNFEDFFKQIVDNISSKVAFERLARGPRQRTDRIQRQLASGAEEDIYTAVLFAIAETGPKTEISYEEIRAALKKILAEDVPRGQEITRVLSKMDEIAKEKLHGEPVLDWDKENTKLFISDPFFAFYLRWAIKNLKQD